MAELGIDHNDIRYANILGCSDAPNSAESLRSPYKQRHYGWRVVDFDKSLKVDSTHEAIMLGADAHLDPLFEHLPSGCVVEPWEMNV